MHKISRVIAVAMTLLTALTTRASDSTFTYRPNIHATLRTRFELATETGDYRFQVRNARVIADGRIAPSIDYFINLDLCDRGKIKILDVWARIAASSKLNFQAGQFRMPFGVAPFRAPHLYFFANRSFVAKQMCNYRAVGVKAAYRIAKPLEVEMGIFTPTAIGDHTPWCKKVVWGGRALLTPGGWKMSAGVLSVRPSGVRANLADAMAGWSNSRWTVEGEYMYKHYVHHAFKPAHAYSVYANYQMPVKAGVFNRLSFQGRFDGLTDHSDASTNDKGQINLTDPQRNRVTVGSTISYIRSKNIFVDLRLNYEKYFYSHSFVPTPENADKIVAELVLRF